MERTKTVWMSTKDISTRWGRERQTVLKYLHGHGGTPHHFGRRYFWDAAEVTRIEDEMIGFPWPGAQIDP